ncbi:MAG TPA: hypothetical protein VHM19_17115 [Polyangiales bacterium]|nr:hypothetical protein [Polyangiales bacterium]
MRSRSFLVLGTTFVALLGGCPKDGDGSSTQTHDGGSALVDAGTSSDNHAGSGGSSSGAAGHDGAAGTSAAADGGAAGNSGGSGEGGEAGSTAADGGAASGLHWYETCGAPLCHSDPVDDPNVANCTTEKAGDACDTKDATCDLVNGCGTKLLCSDHDPTANPGGCPKG